MWDQILPPINCVTSVHLDAVWPDLAKFRHFSITLKNFDNFERVHLVFGDILSLYGQILYATGQIFIEMAKC